MAGGAGGAAGAGGVGGRFGDMSAPAPAPVSPPAAPPSSASSNAPSNRFVAGSMNRCVVSFCATRSRPDWMNSCAASLRKPDTTLAIRVAPRVSALMILPSTPEPAMALPSKVPTDCDSDDTAASPSICLRVLATSPPFSASAFWNAGVCASCSVGVFSTRRRASSGAVMAVTAASAGPVTANWPHLLSPSNPFFTSPAALPAVSAPLASAAAGSMVGSDSAATPAILRIVLPLFHASPSVCWLASCCSGEVAPRTASDASARPRLIESATLDSVSLPVTAATPRVASDAAPPTRSTAPAVAMSGRSRSALPFFGGGGVSPRHAAMSAAVRPSAISRLHP